ncbi:integrase [Paraburkholderia madseniana]|uniref:integrase n=1 Tax=Paraburkholderia madseniana TaxID=2599607 RepID=UPI0038BDAF5E
MPMKAAWSAPIRLGEVLKQEHDERLFFVVKTGDGQRWTHLIDLQRDKATRARNAQPFKLKTEEVLRRLSPGCEPELSLKRVPNFKFEDESQPPEPGTYYFRTSGKLTRPERDVEASNGWRWLTELLTFDLPHLPDGKRPSIDVHGDQFEELLHRSSRDKRIKRCRGDRRSPALKTLRATFRRYLQGGLRAEALMDHYPRCGARGKPRIYSRAPGRKSVNPALKGSTLTAAVRNMLWHAAADYLTYEYKEGKRQQKTMRQSVDFINRVLGQRVVSSNEAGAHLVPEKRLKITVRMLQHLISTQVPYEQRRRHKVGKKQADLHERPLRGTLCQSRGPGDCYHIDATVIDVYIVGTGMRTKVVGRPTLYFVVDDYSRMIVGVHLSLDPASWRGAMLALVNAVSPKVPFCRDLGIYIKEAEWPCNELCDAVFGDGGELSSIHKAQPLTKDWRVDVKNPKSYRPDWRSVMEVRFRIVPKLWTPFVPGVVEKNSFERGSKSPALGAALNRRELLKIIVKAVILYDGAPIRGYPTPVEMIEAGMAATPLNLWNYGHGINGYGRHVNVDEFRSSVLAPDTAVIRGRGIHFKGLDYQCPLSLEERQMLFRAEGKSTEVRVGYNETDPSSIDLYGFGDPIVCPLAEGTSEWIKKLSFAEIETYSAADLLNAKLEVDMQADKRAEQREFTEDVARHAVKERDRELKEKGLKHVDILNIDRSRGDERAVSGSASVGVLKRPESLSNRTHARKGFLKKFLGSFGVQAGAVSSSRDELDITSTEHEFVPPTDISLSATALEDQYQELLDNVDKESNDE